MIEMAKDFNERAKHDEELGLNPDELAFYDTLANNESAVRTLGDSTLKALATELTDKLRSSTTVDWQVSESVRAKLRNLVRRLLRKYKYPPDHAPDAIVLIEQLTKRCGRFRLVGNTHSRLETVLRGHKSA